MAATALRATYDLTVLAKLGVVGIGADVRKRGFGIKRPPALAHRTQNDGSTARSLPVRKPHTRVAD